MSTRIRVNWSRLGLFVFSSYVDSLKGYFCLIFAPSHSTYHMRLIKNMWWMCNQLKVNHTILKE